MRKMYITDNNVRKYIINMFNGFTPQDLLEEVEIKMNTLRETMDDDSDQELIYSLKFYGRVQEELSSNKHYYQRMYKEYLIKNEEEETYLKKLHNVLQSASEKYKRDYRSLFEV